MDSCPKCKSSRGYYFKNTMLISEANSFEGGDSWESECRISRKGEKAHCLNCNRRLADMDREIKKGKKLEYYKVVEDGVVRGLLLKSQKARVRSYRNLHGIELVNATPEDIEKYNG